MESPPSNRILASLRTFYPNAGNADRGRKEKNNTVQANYNRINWRNHLYVTAALTISIYPNYYNTIDYYITFY